MVVLELLAVGVTAIRGGADGIGAAAVHRETEVVGHHNLALYVVHRRCWALSDRRYAEGPEIMSLVALQ